MFCLGGRLPATASFFTLFCGFRRASGRAGAIRAALFLATTCALAFALATTFGFAFPAGGRGRRCPAATLLGAFFGRRLGATGSASAAGLGASAAGRAAASALSIFASALTRLAPLVLALPLNSQRLGGGRLQSRRVTRVSLLLLLLAGAFGLTLHPEQGIRRCA